MKSVRVGFTSLIISLGSMTHAWSENNYLKSKESTASPFMRVYGSSQPPFGFVNFCETNKNSCLSQGSGVRFDATPESLSILDEVNRLINKKIQPATDEEIYGMSEYWTIPVKKGDCEDYALLKQKVLMTRGWPSSALLLTVVRDEKGDGHAVLTARTTQGDFILDNKTNDVRLWTKSPYRFVMRQSYLDPKVWVSLDPQEAASIPSLAGFQNDK